MIKRWFRRREAPRLQVLMVCMGNICRSPMAEGVMRAKLERAGLAGQVAVDSAGTHGFALGTLPDPRAVARASLARITPSAIGDRQMLPMQTISTCKRGASRRWNQRLIMGRKDSGACMRRGVIRPAWRRSAWPGRPAV